jgi:hypothetical protein
MAYTDLVSANGVTPAVGGGNYNFAFDMPVAQDNSPHIVSMGIRLTYDTAAANVIGNGLSNLITALRIKVGSNIIFNWNDNAAKNALSLAQLGVLVQRVGGQDYAITTDIAALTTLSEMSFPVGLSASKSQRVNVSLTLGNEALNMGNQALVAGTAELDMVVHYGIAKEATIIGSRQDQILTAGSTRTGTIFGKKGWSMLGVFTAGDSGTIDSLAQVRVNNGAFRELTVQDWRGLNNSFANPDKTALRMGSQPDQNAVGLMAYPAGHQVAGQADSLFLNLRRISAGANIDIALTCEPLANHTVAFYPVWVAPISAKTGKSPVQTAVATQSTTRTVEGQ